MDGAEGGEGEDGFRAGDQFVRGFVASGCVGYGVVCVGGSCSELEFILGGEDPLHARSRGERAVDYGEVVSFEEACVVEGVGEVEEDTERTEWRPEGEEGGVGVSVDAEDTVAIGVEHY